MVDRKPTLSKIYIHRDFLQKTYMIYLRFMLLSLRRFRLVHQA